MHSLPRRQVFLSLLSLLLIGASSPEENRAVVQPPRAGQPANFSQAVGESFKVEMLASPTELRVDDSLTLTLRVRAIGKWQDPPRRPDLSKEPAFIRHFFIRKEPPQPDRMIRGEAVWEFFYSLRPKDTTVTEVPPLFFVYYKPGIVPPEKGYQSIDTDSILLTVKAAPPPQETKPIQAPERFFQLADDSGILQSEQRWDWPWPVLLALLLLGPPIVAVGWYLLWSRLYPDAARLARHRRSWAARRALQALHAVGKRDRGEQASRSAAILAEYLRHRLELPGGEATPAEAAAHLQQAGYSADLAGKTAEFLRACDLVRFTPDPPSDGTALLDTAAGLILALETESWSSPVS